MAILWTATAYSKVSIGKLDKKKVQKLSFNKMQNLRFAYINFLKNMDKEPQEKFTGEKFSVFIDYYKEISKYYSAYAADGDICFFGGWPSKLKNNLCQQPWKYKDDADVKAFGGGYNQQNACGSPEFFRCNPVLFGAPTSSVKGKENGVDINLTPKGGSSLGYCVAVKGTYIELTQKCEKASRKSIPNLVEALKKDDAEGKDKRDQLEKFHENIEKFCDSYKSSKGEVYDACDDLRKRLADLKVTLGTEGIDNNKADKEISGSNDTSPSNQDNSQIYINPNQGAADILKACENFLDENSSDDIFQRNILGSLKGGLANCFNPIPIPLNKLDLKQLADNFKKSEYLDELTIKNFKQNIASMMLMEKAFMHEDNFDGNLPKSKLFIDNKTAFKQQIAEKFSRMNEAKFSQAFDEIYAQIHPKLKEANFPKLKANDLVKNFKYLADSSENSINNFCSNLEVEYKNVGYEPTSKKRTRAADKAYKQRRSKAKKQFMLEKRAELNQRINNLYAQSSMAFLMGTDYFKDNVMDPTEDYIEECLDNPGHRIINPNIHNSYLQTALYQARDQLMEGITEIPDGVSWAGNESIESDIDHYLKTDRKLVLETLANSRKGGDQEELAKYLCYRSMKIYDKDEKLQYLGIIGGGLVSLAGAVGCAVTAGLGCPLAAGAVVATGSLIAGGSAGYKAIEGYNQSQSLDLIVSRGNESASNYMKEKTRAVDQLKTGATESALNLVPLAFIRPVKSVASGVSTGTELSTDVLNTGVRATVSGSDDAVSTGTSLSTDVLGSSKPGTSLSTEVLDSTSTGTSLSTDVLSSGSRSVSTEVSEAAGKTTGNISDDTLNKVSNSGDDIANSGDNIANSTDEVGSLDDGIIKTGNKEWDDRVSRIFKGVENLSENTVKARTGERFVDSAGKATKAGRDYIQKLQKIKTLPSKHATDDILENLKYILERPRGQGSSTPIQMAEARKEAKALVGKVLNINGEVTKESTKKAYRSLAGKLHADKFAQTPKTAVVAADEFARLQDLMRLAGFN